MTLICLEGVDGAGKSTLVEQLDAQMQGCGTLKRFHFSQPKQHPLAEYESGLDFYRPGAGYDVVCDRFHWGEMIYGALYRDGSQLGAAGFWHVEQYLRSRGGLMVHVTAPLDVIRERLAERGEDYLQSHHVEHVYNEFIRLRLRSYNFPVMAHSPLNEASFLYRVAKLREAEAEILRPFPNYIGPLEPKLLLVGERPNANAKTAPHEAPFLPYPGTSASYLISHVILQAEEPETIGLVNAFGRDGKVTDLRGLWEMLDEPRVAALGNTADRELLNADVPHRVAPHPQYWRRFNHHEPEVYRDLVLREST